MITAADLRLDQGTGKWLLTIVRPMRITIPKLLGYSNKSVQGAVRWSIIAQEIYERA